MAQLHDIQPKTVNKRDRRIGRGGKRGTTSGRGTKGQLARAGHKLRPELRDIIRKLPKKRGYFFNSISDKSEVVNLEMLNKMFEAGAVITPKALVQKGLVHRMSGGYPTVKVLGTGEISKAFTFERCTVSVSAKAKIEKAGGKIVVPAVK